MGDYYLAELIEDYWNPINNKNYAKGEKVIGWEQEEFESFWVSNVNDLIPIYLINKLYSIEFLELVKIKEGSKNEKAS